MPEATQEIFQELLEPRRNETPSERDAIESLLEQTNVLLSDIERNTLKTSENSSLLSFNGARQRRRERLSAPLPPRRALAPSFQRSVTARQEKRGAVARAREPIRQRVEIQPEISQETQRGIVRELGRLATQSQNRQTRESARSPILSALIPSRQAGSGNETYSREERQRFQTGRQRIDASAPVRRDEAIREGARETFKERQRQNDEIEARAQRIRERNSARAIVKTSPYQPQAQLTLPTAPLPMDRAVKSSVARRAALTQARAQEQVQRGRARDEHGRFISSGSKSAQALASRRQSDEQKNQSKGLLASLKNGLGKLKERFAKKDGDQLKETIGLAAGGPLFKAMQEIGGLVKPVTGLFASKKKEESKAKGGEKEADKLKRNDPLQVEQRDIAERQLAATEASERNEKERHKDLKGALRSRRGLLGGVAKGVGALAGGLLRGVGSVLGGALKGAGLLFMGAGKLLAKGAGAIVGGAKKLFGIGDRRRESASPDRALERRDRQQRAPQVTGSLPEGRNRRRQGRGGGVQALPAGARMGAGSVGGRLTGMASQFGPYALAAAAVLAGGLEFAKGYNDKELQKKAFGLKEGQAATKGQRVSAGIGNLLDLGGLTSGIGEMLGYKFDAADISKKVYEIGLTIGTWVDSVKTFFGQSPSEMLASVWEGVKTLGFSLASCVLSVGNKISEFFFGTDISGAWESVKTALLQAPSKILSSIGGILTTMTDFVFGEGTIKAIKDKGEAIVKSVSDFFSGILEWFKDKFSWLIPKSEDDKTPEEKKADKDFDSYAQKVLQQQKVKNGGTLAETPKEKNKPSVNLLGASDIDTDGYGDFEPISDSSLAVEKQEKPKEAIVKDATKEQKPITQAALISPQSASAQPVSKSQQALQATKSDKPQAQVFLTPQGSQESKVEKDIASMKAQSEKEAEAQKEREAKAQALEKESLEQATKSGGILGLLKESLSSIGTDVHEIAVRVSSGGGVTGGSPVSAFAASGGIGGASGGAVSGQLGFIVDESETGNRGSADITDDQSGGSYDGKHVQRFHSYGKNQIWRGGEYKKFIELLSGINSQSGAKLQQAFEVDPLGLNGTLDKTWNELLADKNSGLAQADSALSQWYVGDSRTRLENMKQSDYLSKNGATALTADEGKLVSDRIGKSALLQEQLLATRRTGIGNMDLFWSQLHGKDISKMSDQEMLNTVLDYRINRARNVKGKSENLRREKDRFTRAFANPQSVPALSPASPVAFNTLVPTGNAATDWNNAIATKQSSAEGRVRYQFGGKNSASGGIDCSGWVMESLSGTMSKDIMAKLRRNPSAAGMIQSAGEMAGGLLTNEQLAPQYAREGLIIGIDTGSHGWDRGRFQGIDHIVQTYRDPRTGQLMVSESRSSKGVSSRPYDDWYKYYSRKGTRMFGVYATSLGQVTPNAGLIPGGGAYTRQSSLAGGAAGGAVATNGGGVTPAPMTQAASASSSLPSVGIPNSVGGNFGDTSKIEALLQAILNTLTGNTKDGVKSNGGNNIGITIANSFKQAATSMGEQAVTVIPNFATGFLDKAAEAIARL